MSERVRLQKFLANAGVTSRRKAEELIRSGRVAVNGEVVTELGTRVDPQQDCVTVDQRVVSAATPQWIALHKPAGYLSSRGDPQGRRTIYDLLPAQHRGLFYVGRLDYDTEGLILLTNDGDRAHRLQHPRFAVARVYEVTVSSRVTTAELARLMDGIELDDGPARVLEAQVRQGPGRGSQITVTLAEGRKREVRRIFAALGHEVVRLVRTRYGPISLDDLKPGSWRPLSAREIAALNE